MRSRGDIVAAWLAIALLAMFVCVVSVAPYLLHGRSGFLPNSVGVSTILFLKIGYDRFRELDFAPSMWTALYGAGGPTAVGYASFNPFLLLVSWIKPFAAALVVYGSAFARGRGARRLLPPAAKPDWARAVAYGCGLVRFNFFSSSAGSDPQIGLSILVLPWAVLALQTTIELPSWNAALFLSATMARFYLTSTTQIFGFTVFILIAPLTIVMWGFSVPLAGNRFALTWRNARPLAYVAGAAVAALALTSFDIVAQFQNLQVSLRTLDVSNATHDYYLIAPSVVLISVTLCFALSTDWLTWRVAALVATLVGVRVGLPCARAQPDLDRYG